jgi:uncharacterized CHY-type Zn-finger protein
MPRLAFYDAKQLNFEKLKCEEWCKTSSTKFGFRKHRGATNMTEAEMLICTRCGKPVRMNPFNGYSLCPFCIARNDHTVKDDAWCADKPISS